MKSNLHRTLALALALACLLTLGSCKGKDSAVDPDVPENYFPDDDPTREPLVRWRGHANLLYSNWLNYFVYQATPYDITKIQ